MRIDRLRTGLIALATLVVLSLAPSTASAASHIGDVWCTTTTACVAVGASDNESGSSSAHAKTWNGSAWVTQEIPVPSGGSTSELSSVNCVAACAAVGSFETEDGTTTAYITRWNGTSWAQESAPVPAGATSTKLEELSCTSSTACFAVGSYVDENEVKKSLAMHWNGSLWSLKSVPIPSGAGLSELAGIACTTATDCVAVGSFVNSSEVTKTLAVVWNGSSWSIVSTPEPSGAELSQLQDISCRASEACTAVGQYFDSKGEEKTLALRRTTAGVWSIQTTPNQAGALSRSLTAVSCPSGTACTAVGIVEQGRKELPIVIAWNGTTWSEQSIDSEALGASAIDLTSVFCSSTTVCEATGSVGYGRSAAPRNLAFHYNGTAWLVSEDGGYTRKWVSLDTMERTSDLSSVSCPATQKCFAVGRLVDDLDARRNQVASWSAGSWSAHSGPEPSGATLSELLGVSCASASSCWAVGDFIDSSEVQKPLITRWDGSTWSVQSAPSPSGSQAAVLSGVDCSSTSACTAVGTYIDATGKQVPLAMTFNGSAWSLTSVATTSETAAAVLTAVSCVSSTSCTAVGSQTDSFAHEESLAVGWNGSSWSVQSTPSIEGEAPNSLRGVSCSAPSQCLAVGSYEDESGALQNLALSWNGSAWVEMGVPSNDSTGLTGISCASGSECIAVGGHGGSSVQPPQIFRWNGSSWVEEPPADYPPGASAFELMAVSCVSAQECHATGSASYGGLAAKNIALAYDGGKWFTADATSGGGGLRSVSCLSAESCLTVGDSVQPAGDAATAWILDEDDWIASDTAVVSEAFLSDASCVTEKDCIVVGRRSGWPYKPLAERWKDDAWSTQSMPSPTGRSANLESVSCPTASWCAAAGFSWAVGPGPATLLAETWNGSSWQLATLPLPSGAVSAFLYDISCSSGSACVATGSYTDSNGTYYGLVERWNGTTWTQSSISPPTGQSYRLKGVDCTSSTACTAVGSSISISSGVTMAIAVRWNGTSWVTQTVPLPEGSSASTLSDVDCYSSTRCIAAGDVSDSSGVKPLIVAWANSSWLVEETPLVVGGGRTTLETISCPSAADCVAVGMSQSPGRSAEPFTVQTEGETVAESDDPVKAPSEPPPSLSAAQKEDAMSLLEEDPAFQAAVGAADYDYEVGAWTEVNENDEETLVGAFVDLTLEDPKAWPDRTWPTTSYETGRNGYEEGEYAAADLSASASEIETLEASVDLTFDSNANVIDGETVGLLPMTLESGEIEIDKEDIEYDPQAAGY